MSELLPILVLTLGGVLGAVASAMLDGGTIALPRVEEHRIRLGFVGHVLLCIGVAHAMAHDFQSAFFASLCGIAFLRQVKRHIDYVFEEVAKELDDHHE